MRRGIVCFLVLVLSVACAQPPGAGLASPTASPGGTGTLNCRLPVIAATLDTEPPGGWITFPSGDFASDPTSLHGRLQNHLPSYDRALGDWVPVEARNVAPDGLSYILSNDPSLPKLGGFYLVDARSGNRRLVLSTNGPAAAPGSWYVVLNASEGVYLGSVGKRDIPGLWLLNPTTGRVRLVDGSHYWQMVAGGSAWAVEPAADALAGVNAVYRLDLRTGQVARWYESHGPLSLLSPTSDGGGLLIADGEDGSALLETLDAPNHVVQIELPQSLGFVPGAYLAEPGIWLVLPYGGLALYTKGSGVRIVSTSTDVAGVAGGCL